MNKHVEKILEKLKQKMIDAYPRPDHLAEMLIDIRVRRCRLADRDHYKERRVYAHAGCEDMLICVSSSIELLDDENVRGIFAHEIGHIVAIQMPELIEEVCDDKEIVYMEDMDDDELVADYVTERLFGIRVFYSDNKVQWVK